MIPNRYKTESPDWAWLNQIQVGDILLEGGDLGRERVVRGVSHFRPNDQYGRRGVSHVSFTIRHCSWTGRCYTSLSRSDIKTRRFAPTGRRKESFSLIEKLVAHDILYDDIKKQRVDCCDVKGIR